jgi:hypothetical protein
MACRSSSVRPANHFTNVFEAVRQHGDYSVSFQIGKQQCILLMSFMQRDFVHPQNAYSIIICLTDSSLRLPLEDIQYRHFMQSFLKSHLFSRGLVLHALVDVHLETTGLAPFGFDPLQVLSEWFPTHNAIETPLRKMNQCLHPPDVQVTNKALLLFMHRGRRLQATRTDGHIVFVFTKQVQILLLVFLFNSKSGDDHSRQAQQITQGFRCHCLRCQTIYAIHCSSRIFRYLLGWGRQQVGLFHFRPPWVNLLHILT